jgi:hypothetical protein
LKSGSVGFGSSERLVDDEFEYNVCVNPKAERRRAVAWPMRPNPRKPATLDGLWKFEVGFDGEELVGVTKDS